jgi:hypothetical protein
MGLLSFFQKLLGGGPSIAGGSPHSKSGNGKGDMQLACAECKKTFVFEHGEQRFYEQRGLTPPKRCTNCRRKRGRRRR